MGKQETDIPSRIPIIDFSRLSDPAERSSICAQVAKAAETVGFFEISNSGIPDEIYDAGFEANRKFFALPQQEKMELNLNNKEGFKKPLFPVFQLGYKSFPFIKGGVNRIEGIVFRHYDTEPRNSPEKISTVAPGEINPAQNWWPTNPVDYKEKAESLGAELSKVSNTLLDIFSESLGLPATYLREVQHRNTTVPRFLNFHHYPQGETGDETGIIAHRDSSIFTIVAQGDDVQGLEIIPNGKWIPAIPRRRGLIVNVGDVLQVWSNGKYKSILHRVTSNKDSGRYSLVYFVFPESSPDPDYILEPIAQIIPEGQALAFKPFSYLQYFKNKMLDSVNGGLKNAKTQ